jgi:PTS system ascorbate-specific IIB component
VLKIITVCGLGVGSSLIMKMTVDNVMHQLGVKCNIENWDVGTVKGKQYDLLVTTNGFKKNFADQDNVIFLNNIIDENEARSKVENYLKKNNLI